MKPINESPITYPMRLNRHMYLEKICSRREADRLIEAGQVFVNGKKAKMGQKVEKSDKVTLDKKVQQKQEKKIYLAFNKPVGVVSHNPQMGEKSAEEYLQHIPEKVSPLGRLDKASNGLMLFSNDGTIVDKLLNPKYEHEKEYVVEVDKRIDKIFLTKMQNGVDIEGYTTKPAKISKIDPRRFRLILTEGKKHQIRRMTAALGYQVQSLKRERVQNIRLGKLKQGAYKEITGLELLDFLKSINH